MNSRLKIIGEEPPINANDRKTFIQSEILKINETINKALNKKGFVVNTGTQIKNEFIRFREEIGKYNNSYGIINIENALNRQYIPLCCFSFDFLLFVTLSSATASNTC